VSEFLGVKVDYYAVALFDGFVHAVDALGGVTVDVPDIEGHGRGMNWDDNAGDLHIHLKPGRHHLNGRQALGFVRYRKSNTPGLGDSDEARSGRQQQFLKAMADQHLRATRLPGLLAAARTVQANVETDMTPAEMADLVRTLHGCDISQILAATLPLTPSGWHGHGVYYAYADTAGLRKLLARFEAHLDSGAVAPAVVEALNASGVAGRAREVGSRLATKGFKIARVGNANRSDLGRTVIEYRSGRERDARRARSVLGCGETRPAATSRTAKGAPDLRVYVGRDYRP
jgi:LCP family protein required for cell wall assembly